MLASGRGISWNAVAELNLALGNTIDNPGKQFMFEGQNASGEGGDVVCGYALAACLCQQRSGIDPAVYNVNAAAVSIFFRCQNASVRVDSGISGQ